MLIVLRCDGDDTLGAGHVGRCLPIARAIARAGHEPLFAGRFAGVGAALLDAAGLATEPPGPGPAGVPARADAAVVDVYGLADAELRAAGAQRPTLVVRDEGTGGIAPAIVLDPHADGATPSALLGPDYAAIDPRFAAARRPSPVARSGPTVIALGASTAGAGALGPLVAALREAGHDDIAVAGALDPPPGARALGRVDGLHSVLRDAGALVCGAGVTAYEAACAGVPALLVVLADNQERVARRLAALAPVLDARAPFAGPPDVSGLRDARLPTAGPALVDGHGAARVRDALLAGGTAPDPIRQRPATTGDAPVLLAWRNDPLTRAMSATTHEIAPAEHAAWLDRVLSDPGRELLVAQRGGVALASVRFDRDNAAAEISVVVAPEHRGAGVGTRILREATELQLAARTQLERIVARVRPDNPASLRAFARAGYEQTYADGDWLVLTAYR